MGSSPEGKLGQPPLWSFPAGWSPRRAPVLFLLFSARSPSFSFLFFFLFSSFFVHFSFHSPNSPFRCSCVSRLFSFHCDTPRVAPAVCVCRVSLLFRFVEIPRYPIKIPQSRVLRVHACFLRTDEPPVPF